ncbi:MAG: nuclear transport factor 2 family protein [Acidobacteria bacterium]|nr:nuclear transport factor 2 family protein [Acidobacteriota bacterium]
MTFCVGACAQADVQQIFEAERAFGQKAVAEGVREAFLEILADDAVLFRPGPVSGKEYWKTRESGRARLFRQASYVDVSSNGKLAYTTGTWEYYPSGKADSAAEFGQYVTIWEKRLDGKFRASVDIITEHEKLDSGRTMFDFCVTVCRRFSESVRS